MVRYLPNSFLIEFSTGCEILPLAGNLEIDASDGDVTDPEMWLGTVYWKVHRSRMAWFWLEVGTKTRCSKLGHAAVSGAGLFVSALFCQCGIVLAWLPTDILYSCVASNMCARKVNMAPRPQTSCLASNMCASAKAGLFYHLSFFWGGSFVQCKNSLAKKLFVDSRDSILIRSLFIHVHKRESVELFAIERKVKDTCL